MINILLNDRTGVSGVSQTEEKLTAIILHQRQSEQQRDDVVNVVYVPGVHMSVLEGQLSCVPMCKWLVDAVYN